MKVYSCPDTCPAPVVDYAHYDYDKEAKREQDHQVALKAELQRMGYTGANTGRVVRFSVADGWAQYMLAEGSKSCLIHLPYGDAYQYPDVAYLPKREILDRIEADEKIAAVFAKRRAS